MDMALEELGVTPRTVQKMSFNPCFDGYGSGSLKLQMVVIVVHFVSILVLMDMALEDRK